MRQRETVEQYMKRGYSVIDENQTIGQARNMLDSGINILLVTRNGKPVYVLDNSKISGEKSSQLISNITSRLDEIFTVSAKADLRSVKSELSEKTGYGHIQDRGNSIKRGGQLAGLTGL